MQQNMDHRSDSLLQRNLDYSSDSLLQRNLDYRSDRVYCSDPGLTHCQSLLQQSWTTALTVYCSEIWTTAVTESTAVILD